MTIADTRDVHDRTPVAYQDKTVTVASAGTTGTVDSEINALITCIVVDGSTMDNADDQVRINWKPQGSNASKSSMWYDTDDSGAWGVIVVLSDRWLIKPGDTLEVEFSASQTADADVDIQPRGL